MNQLTLRLPGINGRLLIATAVLNVTLLAVGIYSWSNLAHLRLPVSPLLSVLSVALPFINFTGLAHALTVASKYSPAKLRGFRTTLYIFLLIIADTVLIALAADRLPAGGLTCPLTQRWDQMFVTKDKEGIKTIQDALNCCGLKTVKHEPYPFPGHGVDVGDCTKNTERTQSCFGPWRQQEQVSMGLFLVVASTLVLVKIASLLWLHRGGEKKDTGANGIRRRIEELDSDAEEVAEDVLGDVVDGDDVTERTALLEEAPWADVEGQANRQTAGARR